jgi:hypothetical protein
MAALIVVVLTCIFLLTFPSVLVQSDSTDGMGQLGTGAEAEQPNRHNHKKQIPFGAAILLRLEHGARAEIAGRVGVD